MFAVLTEYIFFVILNQIKISDYKFCHYFTLREVLLTYNRTNKSYLKNYLGEFKMRYKFIQIFHFAALTVLSMIIMTACGDNKGQDPAKFNNKSTTMTNESGLSDFEMENGIGPIKSKLTLEKINLDLVKKGEAIFTTKCASCHKLDERYVGPAQRDVWQRRTPEYILNMMLNPEEMYKRHPEAKKLLAEYMTPMPAQNLSMDDARALLEYFRKVAEEK